jgi:hypothetical protein
MKISRKVGRRSRSSVSRRRLRNKKSYKKNSYRKKHTQRGGKHGRGHKRARTHKRGKRFHRGGAIVSPFTKPTNFDSATLTLNLVPDMNLSNPVVKYTSRTITGYPIIERLRYIKIDDETKEKSTTRYNGFKVELLYDKTNNTLKFTLNRVPEKESDKPLSFTFEGNTDAVISQIHRLGETKSFKSVQEPQSKLSFTFFVPPYSNGRLFEDLANSIRNAIYKTKTSQEKEAEEQKQITNQREIDEAMIKRRQENAAIALERNKLLMDSRRRQLLQNPVLTSHSETNILQRKFDPEATAATSVESAAKEFEDEYPIVTEDVHEDVPEDEPAPAPPASENTSTLPEDWAEYKDDDGTPYYHNPKTDETRWDKPGTYLSNDD